ncbi:Arp2/3 complex 16 kDa subunit ARPC5 [Hortaea werneckii]|nr:Arp2/3 complex 16 kDa subunit ARPC5 [Hortaea werneckii]KAI7107168.1 Arp2/3 complex 16 kDa subunit ARPC5 [Hortaea werneckii]KAI7230382.1 Arp2/3 complex 16 kDa subunit ARPC5 [Hortaea werneckii]KAI7297917.1 Arp2/3 complex 16 kDa subunit ARPC5 [Hortaea werneckii]
MAEFNWRTINVDALDPESAYNFDLSTLTPAVQPVSTADVQNLSNQIRQLMRGGNAEGALQAALENAPYGADEQGKSIHLSVVTEVLGQIRQAEMTPILQRLYGSEGGSELCDTLMKYLYKGMSQGAPGSGSTPKNMTPQATGFSQMGGRSFGGEGGGQAMSVFLSWHEKLVEMVGPGSIVRVMSDRRTAQIALIAQLTGPTFSALTPSCSDERLNNDNNTLHSSSNVFRHQGTSEMAPKKRKAEVDLASRKRAVESPPTRRITRGMTTDAARRAVFDTAELLENILMQLPPRKIFVIQRVCKPFRDIVATSVKLQQRLFLRSDGGETQEWRVAAKDNPDFPNSDWLTTYRFVKSTYIAGADEELGVAFKPVRLGHTLERPHRAGEFKKSRGFYPRTQWVEFRRKINYFGDSSLAKTYLTQPPVQQAILHMTLSLKSESRMYYSGRIEVRNADGLKIADVLRAIRCSRFSYIDRHRTSTQAAKFFKDVSLQDVTGDESLFDKNEVSLEYASMELPGCLAPRETEWAGMSG